MPREAVTSRHVSAYALLPAPERRQKARSFLRKTLYQLGQRLMAWASPPRPDTVSTVLPDALQVDLVRHHLYQDLERQTQLYNSCADLFNQKLGKFKSHIIQSKWDRIRVRITDSRGGFVVQRPSLSPEEMNQLLHLCLEGFDLDCCLHHLADMERNMEDVAVETVIQRIVADEV